ncbi:MAG: hypothetical protein ABIC40_03815, partial [bacterium]
PNIENPTSYTDLFDIDGKYTTHNPYITFETDSPNREWMPGKSFSRTFKFTREQGEKFKDLIFAVAVSWPGPQNEIVEISKAEASGPLYTDVPNYVDFTVELLDWQNDVEYVLIDLQPINGSAFTHLQKVSDGVYMLYAYTAYGLEPKSVDLLVAAKSLGSSALTYNYVHVDVTDPPPPPTNFELLYGPTVLSVAGAPQGECDLAVVGKPAGKSTTLLFHSSTEIFGWDENYSESFLFLTYIDTTGTDGNFPIDPVKRIALADSPTPTDPYSYAILQTNGDTDIWNSACDPPILYLNTLQITDIANLQLVNFKLIADNTETPELDAILAPADVSAGVADNKYGYALWAPKGGTYPGFYPYVILERYAPPYKDGSGDYDSLIGGALEGSGEGSIRAVDITGLAVWDHDGDSNIIVVVSEGDDTNEVEIFSINFTDNPGSLFTSVKTISGLPGSPIDVAILPVGDAGFEDENWIVILTDSRTIEAYTINGDFVESFMDSIAIPAAPLHMDVDTLNMRIHILMSGAKASVIKYTGNG